MSNNGRTVELFDWLAEGKNAPNKVCAGGKMLRLSHIPEIIFVLFGGRMRELQPGSAGGVTELLDRFLELCPSRKMTAPVAKTLQMPTRIA